MSATDFHSDINSKQTPLTKYNQLPSYYTLNNQAHFKNQHKNMANHTKYKNLHMITAFTFKTDRHEYPPIIIHETPIETE